METALSINVKSGNQSLSIGEKIISANQEPKINEAPAENLIKSFRYIYGLLGLREENYPSKEDTVILCRYVTENMKRWSLRDLVNAFTFGIQGKLDINMTAYEKFSPTYLEKVMQAYARFRFNHVEEAKALLPERAPLSEAEKAREMDEGCVTVFDNYQAGKPLIDFGSVTFTHLERIGALSLSIQRKNEIYTRAEAQYLQEQALRANNKVRLIREMLKNGSLELETPEIKKRVREIARLIALKEYFDHLISMGDNLKEVIDSINNPQN